MFWFKNNCVYFLNGLNPASFYLFLFFSHEKYSTILTINYNSIDGVLGTWTQGSRMVGTDESTELWHHPYNCFYCESLNNNEVSSNPGKGNSFLYFNLRKRKSRSGLCTRAWALNPGLRQCRPLMTLYQEC